MGTIRKLKSCFEVETPPGCEGWEEMYPEHFLFKPERREYDESKLWTYDAVHHMGVQHPFDVLITEIEEQTFSASGERFYPIPSAHGTDYRILNGYIYVSPNEITDPELINRRAPVLMERVKYNTENFDMLWYLWKEKMRALAKEVAEVEVRRLPEFEPDETIWSGEGTGATYRLMSAFMKLMDLYHKNWQYHGDLLLSSYVNYMTLFDFCLKRIPNLTPPTIGSMCAGAELAVVEPDRRLKRLAELAVELKIDKKFEELFEKGTTSEQILLELRKEKGGNEWVEELEKARDPWFNFAAGMGGFTHMHVSWNDDLRIPFEAILAYISLLREGKSLGKTIEDMRRERDDITREIRNQIAEEEREAFDKVVADARKVYPFIEGHPFYCEHWIPILVWNKMREFGDIFVEHGFLKDREDIFYLNRYEVWQHLQSLITSYSVGTPALEPGYLPGKIERRKEILKRLSEWTPPTYLGTLPEKITEVTMVMVWGTTTERVHDFIEQQAGIKPEEVKKELKGLGGSAGVVEGTARVVMTVGELSQLQEGEILVAPSTAPAWTPAFSKIKGVVVNLGGLMAHAAIIAREYGIPAVVGTGNGTQVIKTGDLIRIDGSTGVVEFLERA